MDDSTAEINRAGPYMQLLKQTFSLNYEDLDVELWEDLTPGLGFLNFKDIT